MRMMMRIAISKKDISSRQILNKYFNNKQVIDQLKRY